LERCDYTAAAEDFGKVLALEPGNKAARNQLSISRQKQKEAYTKEKELYTNMFQKMAEKVETQLWLHCKLKFSIF